MEKERKDKDRVRGSKREKGKMETEEQRGRERGKEREISNFITFNKYIRNTIH